MVPPVSKLAEPFEDHPSLTQVTIPDLWQQQAVTFLREGKDVVVHAPTGAGKTLIFELWSNGGKHRGQAIYTVPTRALANDKLAETACALERFHLANRAYPPTLAELTPQFLANIPSDFMDGQPLRYRRLDDHKFVLYSVGLDRKDDGGLIPAKEEPGDWVWQIR